jgi:hypothetical protein
MSDPISRLFSTSSSNPQGAMPPSRVLSLRPSPKDANLTVIHPAGYPADAPPLYSLVTSKTTKPNVLFFRGDPDPSSRIGDARFHSLSSTTDMSLRGQPVRMKMSQLSGNFTIECPPMGKLKWHVNQLTGSSLELRDSSGGRLAQLKSAGFPGSGQRKLEILVPCDDFFVDLVLLSGMAAKILTKGVMDAASEVAQAVAGV